MTDVTAPGGAGQPEGHGDLELSTWIRAVVAIDPDAPAVQFEGRWRPWRDLASAIESIDGTLRAAGFGPGTPVGVLMRNRPEVVRAAVGVLGSHRCLVTVNPSVPPAALAAEIERLRLPVLVAGPAEWTDGVRAAARAAGTLGLALDDGPGPAEAVVDAPPADGPPAGSDPDIAVRMLTSGTTGAPKRIDLRYRSLEHELQSTATYSSSGSLDRPRLASGVAITWAPLLHIGGLRGLVTSVAAGRRMALLERFTVPAWVELVREHRPRVISLVPSAMRMVLDAAVPGDVLEGVEAVVSGTAPLPAATADEWDRTYGIPILVVYGATEFAGGVAGWTIRDWRQWGDAKRGSVGRPNQGIDARVVDQQSGAPTGGTGLLEVRGEQLGTGGWLRTTDLARIDGDGFIWIEGRADDVIIRGGFKVATGAVADVLRTHPAVLDAAVIGVPDPRLGTVPVAAVELRPGSVLDEAELAGWARDHLTGYQTPVAFRIVEALPRTPSMKVSQPGVRLLFPEPAPAGAIESRGC